MNVKNLKILNRMILSILLAMVFDGGKVSNMGNITENLHVIIVQNVGFNSMTIGLMNFMVIKMEHLKLKILSLT